MNKIELDLTNIYSFISKKDLSKETEKVINCCKLINSGEGAGSKYLGWRNLASAFTMEQIKEIKSCAAEMVSKCDVVVIIGIGGSFIGSKAVIKALTNEFTLLKPHKRPHMVWAGNNLSGDYLSELSEMLSSKSFGLVVISKSGTTIEPAIAFRVLRSLLEKRYGRSEAARRIIAITDQSEGALRQIAQNEGYHTFTIPENVGGRYSVLSPVGLVPMAIAGIDISSLLEGAYNIEKICSEEFNHLEDNVVAQYAAIRNLMYNRGKKVELFATFEPKLTYLGHWWTQLFAESEGKEHKGIFPTSINYSQDLHSVGQYVQDGERLFFETFIMVEKMDSDTTVRKDQSDIDGLNYLSGRTVSEINEIAYNGVLLAHLDGGVPNLTIKIRKMNAESIGMLLYFFEYACAISGYMLGVNPFDQPGVEEYKNNMYALLDKPGYERLKESLEERISDNYLK